MSINGTERFLQKYFHTLKAHPNLESDFWQSVIDSVRKDDSIKQRVYETLEILLNQELDKLDRDQLIAIYKETENWLSLDEPAENEFSIELIKIELIEEMMDQITSIAWEQAKINK